MRRRWKSQLTVYAAALSTLFSMGSVANAEPAPSAGTVPSGIIAWAKSMGFRAALPGDAAADEWFMLANGASPANHPYCLDAASQTIRDDGIIHLWTCTGAVQQHWKWLPGGYLMNRASPAGTQYVLDAAADQIRDGGKIHLWHRLDNAPQQQWSWFNGDYFLRNGRSPAGTNYVLDAAWQTIRDGGIIHLWRWHPTGEDQQWWLPVFV